MAPLPLWQHNKEEEEETGEKESIRGISAFRWTPTRNNVSAMSFLPPQDECSHKQKQASTHTHHEEPMGCPLHLARLFDFPLTIFSRYIANGPIWIHYAQCQYWCNMAVPQTGTGCWMSVRTCQTAGRRETRGATMGCGREIKGAPAQAKRFPAPRRQWEGIKRWLWAGLMHHNSIFRSVLPHRPVSAVKQLSVLTKNVKKGEIGGGSGSRGGKEKADESGDELFCSVAMVTWQPELWRADSCHAAAGRHGWQLSVNGGEWGDRSADDHLGLESDRSTQRRTAAYNPHALMALRCIYILTLIKPTKACILFH